MKKFTMVGIALLSIFIPLVESEVFADELSDLKKRVDRIERKQNQQSTHIGDGSKIAKTFFEDNLTIGGFYETAITEIGGPDTTAQVNVSQNTLGLNIAAEFNERLKFVTQLLVGLSVALQNQHNDPRATSFSLPGKRAYNSFTFGALPAQGYLEYSVSDLFNVRAGMGYVPFGSAFQLREPVLFVRRGGPQILRTTELLSPLWAGMHFSGIVQHSKNRSGYDIYTAFPTINQRIPSAGARGWHEDYDYDLLYGLSYQIGKGTKGTYNTLGTDVSWKIMECKLKTEYVRSIVEGWDDPWGVYLQPEISIFEEKYILYGFIDYSSSALNKTGTGATALNDPYRRWEYGGGVNWLPTVYTRLRFGVTFENYVGDTAVINNQNRDYVVFDLSAGVAF